jgi:antirestriction protein ArdC
VTSADVTPPRDLAVALGSVASATDALIVELAVARLCAEFGVPGRLRHPELVTAWITTMKQDSRFVIAAAEVAQVAADSLNVVRLIGT